MGERKASCACGELRAIASGDPVRISVCHCLECQKRTGSAFGAQARFADADLKFEGDAAEFTRSADSGGGVSHYFCRRCGTTLYWRLESVPNFTSVAVGAFADPAFPAPWISIYEVRRHPWATIEGDTVEHLD